MQSVFHRTLRRSPGASPQFTSLLDSAPAFQSPEDPSPIATLRAAKIPNSPLFLLQTPHRYKAHHLQENPRPLPPRWQSLRRHRRRPRPRINYGRRRRRGGGTVHCLDCRPEAGPDFLEAQARAAADTECVGSLHYSQVDVHDVAPDGGHIRDHRAPEPPALAGLVAAAGIQGVQPAIDYSQEHMREMMDVNYGGVMFAAAAAARQMIAHKTPGNIMLVASMSGKIANKGLISSVYNSSKAAVIQLGKNLAMEWAPHGIRVNSLSPGHIVTPMVQQNFDDEPHLEALWARENMMGRLSSPEEFKGAALFLLSDASTFMTGSELVIDGGHTAW
ncbi:hypothetical protein VE04_08908 [Pseudogymnoascus sp. 24MN13]|nr:hypothetical protein VE04_08908 [Pseudogymnoascus sp. 24MN13]